MNIEQLLLAKWRLKQCHVFKMIFQCEMNYDLWCMTVSSLTMRNAEVELPLVRFVLGRKCNIWYYSTFGSKFLMLMTLFLHSTSYFLNTFHVLWENSLTIRIITHNTLCFFTYHVKFSAIVFCVCLRTIISELFIYRLPRWYFSVVCFVDVIITTFIMKTGKYVSETNVFLFFVCRK